MNQGGDATETPRRQRCSRGASVDEPGCDEVVHPGYIYLIHLDKGMAVRTKPDGGIVHARHYIGWTSNHDRRLADHAAGNGSSFMAEVRRRGISWSVIRMWEGTRSDERKIKKRREAPRFCPVCVAEREDGRGLLSPGLPEISIGGSQMEIKKFCKRPVEIEAVQLTEDAKLGEEIAEWCGGKALLRSGKACIDIETWEGTMRAEPGDWIIKEPFPADDRLFYPCKPEIFERIYEKARTLAERLGDSPEQRAMDGE